MNLLLIDMVGAAGFQLNDVWTTFLGIKAGAAEANAIFKFLDNGRPIDFAVVGLIKVLFAIFLYELALQVPAFRPLLELDFYFEAGVTLWNVFTIFRHKRGWKW